MRFRGSGGARSLAVAKSAEFMQHALSPHVDQFAQPRHSCWRRLAPKNLPLHGSPVLAARGRCHMKHWASRECARSEAKPFFPAVRYFEPGAKITILTSRRLSQISYEKKTRLEYSDQAH